MQIDNNVLIAYGGVSKKYHKSELIFQEGSIPYFLYQIVEGEVKIFSNSQDGKEFIQGIFRQGETFGEPPVLLGKPYPSTAIAKSNCVVLRISRARLLNLLEDFPSIQQQLLYALAERIYNKSNTMRMWLSRSPEDRIRMLFDKLKEECEDSGKMVIPYTRQQLADLTGLRVETVIRTLARMSKENKLEIIDHKVYY